MAEKIDNGAIYCDRFGYRFPGKQGAQYKRVTTLKGVLGSGSALIDWAARCVAERAQELVTLYTIGELSLDALLVELQKDELKTAHNQKRDTAADFGTTFHQMVEGWANGDQNVLHDLPDSPEIWSCAEAFANWNDTYEPNWIRNEFTVFNDTMGYAGTVDALVEIQGVRILLDVKTSKGIYGEYALQLAAYRNAEWIGTPTGDRIPMEQVDECAILHVRPKTETTPAVCNLLRFVVDDPQWAAFKSCCDLYRWQKSQPQPEAVDPLRLRAIAAFI